MREPKNPNNLEELEDVNYLIRQRYQEAVHFHGFIICFDITSKKSFSEAVDLYKEIVRDVYDPKKVNRYAKIPVCFVGTKLDQTDFIRSDDRAKPRVIKANDLEKWVKSVHKRAESCVLEVSSKENIGVSIMVDWVVREALRVYPSVEKKKYRKAARWKDQ